MVVLVWHAFKRVGDVRFGFVGYEVWHLGFAEKVG